MDADRKAKLAYEAEMKPVVINSIAAELLFPLYNDEMRDIIGDGPLKNITSRYILKKLIYRYLDNHKVGEGYQLDDFIRNLVQVGPEWDNVTLTKFDVDALMQRIIISDVPNEWRAFINTPEVIQQIRQLSGLV